MIAQFAGWVLGQVLSLSSSRIVERAISVFNQKQDIEIRKAELSTDAAKARLATLLEMDRNRADEQRFKMSKPVFWFIVSIALGPMLFKWTMINLYDVLWCAGCVYPQPWTIAAYEPPFDRWAETAFGWIFNPVGVLGLAVGGAYVAGRR